MRWLGALLLLPLVGLLAALVFDTQQGWRKALIDLAVFGALLLIIAAGVLGIVLMTGGAA